MKKTVIFYFSALAAFMTCGVFTYVLLDNQANLIALGETPSPSIQLDENQRISTSNIPSAGEISSIIKTRLGNSITLSGFNVVNYSSGWQSLLPGGYFYNPINSSTYKNKISGLKSITYNGSGTLSLHYGCSLNDNEVLYSTAHDLIPGEEYILENNYSTYFYIKNNSGVSIDIDDISLEYLCAEEAYPNNNLKILMIGNSFADDTVFYSQRIANSLGISVELYDAYIGGCTIDNHYANIQNGATTYSMRSMNGSNWNYQDNMSLGDIVTYTDWDIITFQQASAEVGRPGKYSNLVNLVNEVKSRVTGNPKYYWHQTWAYDKDYSEYYDYFSYFNNDQIEMFNAIVDCYNNNVVPTNIFEKTIFNGTAVQNLRTSYMKDSFSRDGKHMSLVHGRYLLASNFISSVFDIDFDLSPVSYVPEGMNRSFLALVNESIMNAQNNPNVISNSKFTNSEMGDYDLSNYTEIDAGLVGCSFYNCTDSANYNKRINHTDGTSNKYATTYRFTYETLPVGSLVFCQEGLGYRPEAWVNDAVQSSRKAESYKNVLKIDDAFWNGYQYRAFNIFKAGKQTLSGQYVDQQYDDIFDGFHIFVPNDLMGGLTPKGTNTYYYSDTYLFENRGLDIDNYERLHLDPITGFYKCDSYYYLMNSYVDATAQRFVCTRPFVTADGDLPEGTVLIVDSGYQWRSDCWGAKATYSPRPDNVSTNFTILNSSFMSSFRRRTFNVSRTDGYTKVGQNSIEFMNHFRIYIPTI